MLRHFVSLGAPFVLRKALKRQDKFGFRLQFKNLPKEWLNGYMLADMTRTWHKAGLKLNGLNYFTIGAIKSDVSTRFDPKSPMYQAWLGGYLVQFEEPNSWVGQDHYKLAEADQKKWLWYFGDPDPRMEFGKAYKKATEEGRFSINGFTGTLYYWDGLTHSDVGKHSNRHYNKVMMEGMAQNMNQLNPGLHLEGRHFMPRQALKEASSYSETALFGLIGTVDIKPGIRAVLYVCTTNPSVDSKNYMRKLLRNNVEIVKA